MSLRCEIAHADLIGPYIGDSYKKKDEKETSS